MTTALAILKTFARYLGYAVLALVCLLVLALLFVGFTPVGARLAADQVAKLASTPDRQVVLGTPSGLLSGHLRLDSVVVSDTKGPYAELRDIAVDWSPLSLLTATFHAEQVSAGLVSVERPPVVTETPSSSSDSSSGGLPVAIRIERMQFPDIRLGAALAGDAYRLQARGTLTAERDRIESALDVNRADLAQAGAHVVFAFAPAENRLDLDAKVAEPAGGLVAGLLRLPGRPALSFDISGAGPLSDWSGKLSAALDGKPVLAVDGRHQGTTDGGHHLIVKGGGSFDSVLPPVFRPLFAGTTDIDLSAALTTDGRLTVDNGRLTTGSLDLTATGTFDPKGDNDLSARLTGKAGPVDFRWPLAEGEARVLIDSATLAVTGPANAAKLDLAAALTSLDLPQGHLGGLHLQARSDAFDLSARSGRIASRLSIEETKFASADLDRVVRGPLQITAPLTVAGDVIAFQPLALESGSLGGTATGQYDLAAGSLDADLRLFAVPSLLPPGLAEKFAGTIALAGKISTARGGAVSVTDLTLKSDAVEASGKLSLDAQKTLDAALTGNLPEIGKWLTNGRGAATFTLSATGPLSAPAVKATVAAEEAELAGRKVVNLSIAANGTASAEAPSGTIAGNGSIAGQPIQIDAALDGKDGTITIPTLKLSVGPNRVDGQLAFSPEFLPEGKLNLDLPDLGLVFALAGQQAEGDLKGSATIGHENGRIQAAISASGSGLRTDAAQLLKPDIDLTISDLQALVAKGRIRAEAIEAGGNRVDGLTVDIAQQADSTDFALDARYDDQPLRLNGNARTIDGAIAIGLDSFSAAPLGIGLSLADPTTITVEKGVVTVPALTVRLGDGRITIDGTAGSDLALNIRVVDLPAALLHRFTPGVTVDGLISAKAAITGPASAPQASFDLSAPLTAVELPQGRFEDVSVTAKAENMTLSGPTGVIDARVQVRSAALKNADLARALTGPITIEGPVALLDGKLAFNGPRLTTANLDGTVKGVYDIAARTATANVDLSVRPAALPPAIAAKFDEPVNVTAAITAIIGGVIQVDSLAIQSKTLTAEGKAALSAGQQLSASLTGSLPDLGKLLTDAKGTARFDLTASGPLNAPTVKASLAADRAELAGRALTGLTLTADALADADAPQATVKASGSLGGQAIDVDAHLATTDGKVALDRLNAVIGRNRIEGALAFTPAFLPQGKLNFDLPDLGLLAALAGQKASGDLKGAVDLAVEGDRIKATVNATGSGIRQDDLRVVNPVIDIRVNDLSTLNAEGTVKAQEIVSGENRVNGLVLTAKQDQGRTDFDLKANYDGAPAVVTGNVSNQQGIWTIGLNQFSAAPRRIPLKLDAPTTIRFGKDGVQLSNLGIRAGSGVISVTGTSGTGLALDARISNLPANLANAAVPSLGAEGTISGTVALRGSTAAPQVDYQLTWNKAALTQTKSAGVAAFDIRANGRLADNTLRIDTTLSGAGGLALSGGGTVGITDSQPLALAFRGTVPFSLLAAQLSAQGLSLEGNARIDLSIGGTASAPAINGTVTADGARLIDVRRNIALNNIGLTVAIDREAATISRLTGKLAQGGTVAVTGRVGIAPGSNFPADLAVKLDKAAYVDGQLVATVVSGNLTLTGPILTAPVLGGTLQLGKTSITVPEKLPASLAEINVKHRNAPADVRAQAEKIKRDEGGGSGTQSSIGLNLTISAPSQIFVRGRGIDAELGGDLTVRGTASEPIVSGGFEMRRGRLIILNKRLDFTNGKIGFGGSLTPTLDMAATNVSGSTTITVSVTGAANDPAISFSSSPALPQDEILAQLIFGQSMSKLSALQIAQLADAASQLAGGRSTSLFQSLRSKLGVDDLDISTDEKGEARVSAGKYLNSRTYIELQGGGASGGKAIINLDVGRGVKLRGEAGGNGEGAAGIFYEKEY